LILRTKYEFFLKEIAAILSKSAYIFDFVTIMTEFPAFFFI